MTNPIKELKEKIAMMQHNLKVLEQLEAQKTDVEKAYRDVYGHFPETSGFAMSDADYISWDAFQKGYEAAQSKNTEPYCPDEPEYYDEVECDEKDNPNLHFTINKNIIDKMVEERKAQKLWNRLHDELGLTDSACLRIVDVVEDWMPKEQSAAGSQNVNTELLVEGFNDCVRTMKGTLR